MKNGDSRVPLAQNLVYKARHYAESNHAESLSAFVPAIQPYVDVYKNAGFEPVRRSIRIGWELIEQPTEHRNVRTEELSKEHANEAVQVWVEGHRPYWDWWIEEQGGPEELRSWVESPLARSPVGWEPSLTRN